MACLQGESAGCEGDVRDDLGQQGPEPDYSLPWELRLFLLFSLIATILVFAPIIARL